MKSPDLPKRVPLSVIFWKSSPVTLPLLKLEASTLACMAMSLLASCAAPISSEKMPTPFFPLRAMCSAMFSANAVLPIEGLAAIRMKSEFWKPEVI